MTLYSAVNLEGKKNNQKSRIFVFVVPTRGTSYLESQWRDYYNHDKFVVSKYTLSPASPQNAWSKIT